MIMRRAPKTRDGNGQSSAKINLGLAERYSCNRLRRSLVTKDATDGCPIAQAGFPNLTSKTHHFAKATIFMGGMIAQISLKIVFF
jgi:hypothetical protein